MRNSTTYERLHQKQQGDDDEEFDEGALAGACLPRDHLRRGAMAPRNPAQIIEFAKGEQYGRDTAK